MKINMTLAVSFFFCFLLLTCTIYSQTKNEADYPKVVSPSPEAAALGKYGQVPMSLFSGTPQISIPVFSLKNGSIDAPISLDYDASGIRVDQVATNVGLGWSLVAGGVITRTVLGLPDEVNPGYFPGYDFNPTQTQPLEFGNVNPDYIYARELVNENKDMERDIYFYNFAGYTGRFVKDWTGAIKLIPANPDFKIEALPGNSFKITDDKGFRYYFTVVESCLGTNEVCTVGSQSPREPGCMSTAWFLSKIESPDNRNIVYEYETYTYTLDRNYAETEYMRAVPNQCTDLSYLNRKCKTVQRMQGIRLKRILASNNVKVDFNYAIAKRLDLTDQGQPAGNYLENIKVYADNLLKKTTQLTYGYFSYPAAPRLKLLSVKQDSLPPHEFYYNETYNLPVLLSKSQDHWGYYNGKSNPGFIPPVPLLGKATGADREPDFTYMQAGSLTKILYPSGGSTEFEYEPHTERITESNVTYQNAQASVYFVSESNGNYVTTTNFTLDSGATDISTYWELINTNYDEQMTGTIIDNTTSQAVLFINTPSGNMSLAGTLSPGRSYQLQLQRQTTTDHGNFIVQWKKPVITTVTHNNIVVGGLRIRSIKSYSSPNQLAFEKYYGYNWIDDTTKSSILSQNYKKEYWSPYGVYTSGGEGASVCGYTVFSSSSTPELGNGLDNIVGYRQVVERSSSINSNGRTIYKYSAGPPDVGIPFGIIGQMSGFQGLLLEQIDQKYNAATASFFNIRKIRNTYSTPYGQSCYLNPDSCVANQSFIPNMQISFEKSEFPTSTGGGATLTYPASFVIKYYYTVSALISAQKKEEIVFGPTGADSIVTTSTYFYSNTAHKNPTRIDELNSKSQVIRKDLKYAYDFAALPGNPPNVYNEMAVANLVSPSIEEKSINVTNGNAEISKKQTLYKKWNGVTLQPEQILYSANGNALEPEVTFTKYDTTGNIVSYTGRSGEPISFLWDYNKSYPIAKVVNADSASIAHTSFEGNDKGNFTFNGTPQVDATSITGKKAYSFTGSNAISKAGLNSSAVYIVSYWTKNTSPFTITGTQAGYPITGLTVNGWKYFEHRVTGQSQITIGGASGLIDEVRLYPAGAQMSTYTYDPVIGMTSQCDIRNAIIYYVYDVMGRLILVRDQDGNILKKFCYNYAGQPENCVTN